MADGVGQVSLASRAGRVRNDSTLVTKWPEAFDIKEDILIPGKATTFKRQMDAALRTRGLLDAI